MRRASVAELESHLGQLMSFVERGEELEICKQNVPFARIVPLPFKRKNQTRLGCDLHSVTIESDLTQPAVPEEDWSMLEGDP